MKNLKITQIDFREISTLIYFEYTNDTASSICIKEDISVVDKSSNRKYHLLKSINLPICNNSHRLDSQGQKHNFVLEFEKLPANIENFDIIESNQMGFNLYGIKIDKLKREDDYQSIYEFIKDSKLKEFGHFYKEGGKILYYNYNGLKITARLTNDLNYGKYYHINISISNLSGKDLLFNPNLITTKLIKDNEIIPSELLTYEAYMKKVNRRQKWNTVVIALSEGNSASNAGYSNSMSITETNGYSSTNINASGFYGKNYGSLYGSSITYGSTYSTTYSQTYDGAANYAAQQNANRNISNFQSEQFSIKKTISDGYLKIHTVLNETEYSGFINVPYKKADKIEFVIPLNNTNFYFVW